MERPDLDLLRSIGRHVAEIAAVALQPQGHVAGGALGAWLFMLGKWSFLAVVGTPLVTLACERAVAPVVNVLRPPLRGVVGAAGLVATSMLIAAPNPSTRRRSHCRRHVRRTWC
jgi:hypothetical protein